MLDGRHVAASIRADPRNVQHLSQQSLVHLPGDLNLAALDPIPATATASTTITVVGNIPDQEVALVVVDKPAREIVYVIPILAAGARAVNGATDG